MMLRRSLSLQLLRKISGVSNFQRRLCSSSSHEDKDDQRSSDELQPAAKISVDRSGLYNPTGTTSA